MTNKEAEEFLSAQKEKLSFTHPYSVRWYVKEDDLIGGYCIMYEDLPPSESYLCIVWGVKDKELAHYIVELHNNCL